jgi:hypothetical protein
MSELPKLYHYRGAPFDGPLLSRDQSSSKWSQIGKPWGFWVSCCDDKDTDGTSNGWWDWCKSEEFRMGELLFRHTVTICPDAKILHLKTHDDLERFTDQYPSGLGRRRGASESICWQSVADRYQGIIISPYQWTQRLELMWYYGWDCASGCIWDADAVVSIECDMPNSIRKQLCA